MQETMDILRTLNECQAKVDLSYQEERGICPNETDELVFIDRDQIMFTPRRSPVLAEDEVNEREQSSVCPSPDPSLSCNASGNLEMSLHVNETEVTEFCDENEPRHCSQSSDVSTHEPKIPKPSRIPCHTLTPSFHLMNPPASIQRNQLSLATPSHIPLGPLKFLNGHPAKSQPSMETTKRLSDLVGRVPSDEL
ncbi:hypothetical protein P879_09370 [Paragonimus westermani]|uniref:Uncharacterized protein n=1 Tax=Paragonimus westermani TaxID=34504 RepID=A0A8T0DEU6_9TREM|nr:hypothetical protein P879_09370 [Paragonimus westermani]